jgi:hypothetical protein
MYGWIAHIACAVLLVLGWTFGEIGPRTVAIAVAVWCAVFITGHYLPSFPPSTVIALLDIVLVFVIFRGDVQLR